MMKSRNSCCTFGIFVVVVIGSLVQIAHTSNVHWNLESVTLKRGGRVNVTCTAQLSDEFDNLKIALKRPKIFDDTHEPELTISDAGYLKVDSQSRYVVTYSTSYNNVATLNLVITDAQDTDTGNFTCYRYNDPDEEANLSLIVTVPMQRISLQKTGPCSEYSSYDESPFFIEGLDCGLACIAYANGYVHERPKMRVVVDEDEDVTHLFTGDMAVEKYLTDDGLVRYFSYYWLFYRTSTPSLLYNGRNLTCRIYNSLVKTARPNNDIAIQMKLVVYNNPVLYCERYDIRAKVNSTVFIKCFMYSNPASEFQWEFDGRYFSEHNRAVLESNVSTDFKVLSPTEKSMELRIEPLKWQNYGEYHISAAHPITRETRTVTVSVTRL